jgi:membrane dipeptidase
MSVRENVLLLKLSCILGNIMVELSKMQEERAMRLHKEAIVVDTHCDSLGGYLPRGRAPPRSFVNGSEDGQIDLPKLIDGGVTCQTFAMFTASRAFVPEATLRALQMVDKFYEMTADPKFMAVTTVDEIKEAKRKDKVSGLLSIEGAEPLMGEIPLLRVFYRLGVRMLSFAWNYRTPFADGLGAKRAESKLPELGVLALEEMDRLGMVFDVSHLPDSVFWDVNDLMKGPLFASHSNCRCICDHARNLTDDMIQALAAHDGVMGMNYLGAFVDKDKPSLEKLVDHIDHISELVGPEHVGLGSDYDGGGNLPDLEDTSKVPNITRELVRREYSDDDILKILGGNHLRVFKAVFK